MTISDPSQFSEDELVALLPMLFSFSRRFCHNAGDAEDLVQETICKALANREKFSPGTSLKSWMFTIMRNTFCTQIKRANREQPGAGDCVASVSAVKPDQEWHLQMMEFDKAFGKLSQRHRETVQFLIFDGETYEMVARRHHCPVGTVKSRLNRAREKLTQKVGMEDMLISDGKIAHTASVWKTR